MATTPPPIIDLLPDPPLPTDTEGVFDAKAGASLTAQQLMIPQINTSLSWIGQQVTAIDGYRQAAAQSAGDAQTSANAASSSKEAAAQSATDATNNGKAQVSLAKDQVTLAQQAATSAQVAAAAAQSAAGLPSLAGNAYKVLRVNATNNGVEWGLGLPVLPSVAGAPGKVPTLAANGTSLIWAELNKIGDIITCTRNPGSLWLPADGSIRAQSSYPVLFAALGLIGNAIGSVWQTTTISISPSIIASGVNGTTISVSPAGLASRSTDRGQSWGASVDLVLANVAGIGTDGKGTWIVTTSNLNGLAKRSLDDGVTWSNISLPGTAAAGWNRAVYTGNTTWISNRGTNDTVMAISTNNGLTWSTFTHGFGNVTISDISSDEAGVVIAISGTSVRRSSDYGQTFNPLFTPASGVGIVGTDKLGVWIISGNANTASYVSTNNGLGFTLTPMGSAATPVKVLSTDAGLVVLFALTTHYIYKNGVFGTFTSPGVLSIQASSPGNNILLTQAGSQRALPYIYDTTSQFQLPAVPVVSGVKSYIKALEMAA